MEYGEKKVNDEQYNIEVFSSILGKKWKLQQDVLKNYIFSNISMALARNTQTYEDIDSLYIQDKLAYYEAAVSSTCIEYIVMVQGNLQQEIYARKVLGMLILAEDYYDLRNKLIKLLRKYYSVIYRSVKKMNSNELKARYMKMSDAERIIEAKMDAAVYFYFAVYCSADAVDQGHIISIMDDVSNFQINGPLMTDINKELVRYKNRIEEIKAYIFQKFGSIGGYNQIINSPKDEIYDLGSIIKNIFLINKLNIDYFFNNLQHIDIEKIILAYIKSGYTGLDSEVLQQTIIFGVFIQSMIYQYNEARKLYFESNDETINFRLKSLEEKHIELENTSAVIRKKLNLLEDEKELFNKKLEIETNKLKKIYNEEINVLENTIRELKIHLEEERQYRSELHMLREYIFKQKSEYVPYCVDETLENYIINKRILIIGGTKNWRRRFRENYPDIATLNGFNDNFDISVLNNADFIFFYTGYMNHSTYNKAMAYIRAHRLKFGYIGKTNMDLVEEEIIDELKSYRMGRRLNLSD